MNIKLKIALPLSLMAAVGISSISTIASAAGSWKEPGASCQPFLGSDTGNFYRSGDTGISRSGTGSGYVECPMGGIGNPSYVYASIYHPTYRTTGCSLERTNYYTGSMTYYYRTRTHTGNSYTYIGPLSNTYATNYDPVVLDCYLAQGTVLRSYDWDMTP